MFGEYTHVSLCNVLKNNNAVTFSVCCDNASLIVCLYSGSGGDLSEVSLHMELVGCVRADKACSVNLTLSCMPFPRCGVGVIVLCGIVKRASLSLVVNVGV